MPEPLSTIVSTAAVIDATSALVTSIATLFTQLATAVATTIAACAVIAKYMPPPEGNTRMAKIHKIINSWGQNAGYAANKE